MPVHVILDIIDDKTLHAHHGCPIPHVVGPGSRYKPTEKVLRRLALIATIRRLVDKNETKAVATLVEDMEKDGALAFYNSGRCVCNVSFDCFGCGMGGVLYLSLLC